ncbi:MAG: hybrid sensor histidine kinase/response regulator [Burkholderiales bacterium]|nr:hybrid sensor histidine kinase/response regulator [Burkholderiales bacterium]
MSETKSSIGVLLTPPRSFSDPATETAFLSEYRRMGLQFAFTAFVLGAASVLIFLLVVAVSGDPNGLDTERQTLRFSFAMVLLATAWLFRYREGWVLRFYVPAVLSVITMSGVIVILLAVLTNNQELGQNVGLGRVSLAMVLVLWVSYGFQRLPVQFVTPALILPSIFVVVHTWVTGDSVAALSITLYAIVAHAVGIILCMQTERRERAVFAHALELEQANAKIAAQAKHNQELSEAKSLVLASVSHDLRQPLSSLSLYVNMLRAEANDPETAEIVRCADHMQTCVGAMEGNLSRILEISRAQTLGAGFPVSVVDLANVLAGLRTIFTPAATAAGIELRFQDLAPGVFMVTSNPERLHEVLSNLLSNAIKFANHDRRRGCWAHVGVIQTASGLRIDVRDNGIGIPSEHQDRVFNEYYQVGNPARKSAHGYGLGLSMVRSTIGRLPGHSLAMYSRPGKGSRFSVYVPQATASSQTVPRKPASEPAASEDGEILVGSMVLIVEDDDSLRNALSDQLISWGAVVEVAENCDEALEIARSCERLIDAVISDFKLPGEKNGIEVIRLVRETQPHLVAALITSGEYSFDRNLIKGMEAVRFLPKPIAPETLRAELTMAIKSSLASAANLN